MRIRRSKLTRDYLQIPNRTARDNRLSHMARGILIEILSHPDGWETTADDMWRASVAKRGKESPGRRQFRAAFAELKAHGYITAEREKLDGGRYGTVLIVTDVPHAGTSERPAKTRKPVGATDVPHGGTSERPAEMDNAAGETDVPDAGTSERPGETNETAGGTDVPHGGTSKRENGEKTEEPKTAPPHECGPKSSESLKTAAAPSSLRSEGLPLKPVDDHLPSEDPLPVSVTATIPGARREPAEPPRTMDEINRDLRHHNQGCGYCQAGYRKCTARVALIEELLLAPHPDAS